MSESETNPKTEPEKKEEATKTVSDEKAAEGEEEIGIKGLNILLD